VNTFVLFLAVKGLKSSRFFYHNVLSPRETKHKQTRALHCSGQRVFKFLKNDGNAIARQVKRRLPKRTARFPTKKKTAFSTPLRFALGLPTPSPRVRTVGPTLNSQPKFLASIGYQIPLPMVLRSKLLQLLSPFCYYFCLCLNTSPLKWCFVSKKWNCHCKRCNIRNPCKHNLSALIFVLILQH